MINDVLVKFINFLIAILLMEIFFISCIATDTSYKVYESETKLHYKLDRVGDNARLYISHTDTFGTDFVEFYHTTVCFPEFYYVNPDTLYIVDKNGFFIRSFKSSQFDIEVINLVSPTTFVPGVTTLEELEKSEEISMENKRIRADVQEKSKYIIRISDYASGITIYNAQNEVIAKDVNQFIFRGS